MVLFVLAVLLAGCGSTTAGRAPSPTATRVASPVPSATPHATPAIPSTLTPISLNAFASACGDADVQGHAYRAGDLYLDVALSNLAYPSAKLPDGVALKPFKLANTADALHGLSALPEVNPDLERVGVLVEVCSARAGATYHVESGAVHIDSFVPYTGALNSWQFCSGFFQNGHQDGGGCGGGSRGDAELHAVFATSAGTGSVAQASLATNPLSETALPPNQSRVLTFTFPPPTAPGTYQFSFSVTIDGAKTPFAALPDQLLLDRAARAWTGDACATPTMQAQIPSGSADSYICPGAS